MSLATETLDRIRDRELIAYIKSPYITLPSSVDDDGIFEALTHDEKLHYSDRSGLRPVLNIWTKSWMYVADIDTWALVAISNLANDNLSWYPDFVRLDDGYLLDVENAQLYKTV